MKVISQLKIKRGKVDIHELRKLAMEWYKESNKEVKEFIAEGFEFYINEIKTGETDTEWGLGLW